MMCSVFLIEHPKDPVLTPAISPAMACVMNLTVQYFTIYLALFIAITVKQFGGAGSFLIVILEGRQKTARLRENIKSMEHVRTGRMLERYMGKP